jgi:HK97 family phage portal protein
MKPWQRLTHAWRALTIQNYAPHDDYWYDRILRPTAAGVDVSHDEVLGITAFWNGVHLIANALAMVPLRLHRRKSRGTDEAREDRRFRIVNRRPNPWQTAFGWRQMKQGHLLLRGNTYSQKVMRGDGTLDSLVPLHPTRMEMKVEDGTIWYIYRRDDGSQRVFPAREILHLKGLSTNGLLGYCPVTVMRESLGAVIATDRFSARFFKNDARPRGIVKSLNAISDTAFKRLKAEWMATNGGEGQQGTAFLDNGLEFQSIGTSPEDSQLLGSRTFNVQEAARILNIPPHKLKEMSRSTFSNIEHQSIEWVVDTIQPWAENWEQQLDADLLSEREQATLFFKFDLKALLRGDSAQRAAYMQARFNMGTLSQNDIRALDDEDPIAGGDRYYLQQNLMPLDKVDEILAAKNAPPQLAAPKEEEPEKTGPALVAFGPILRDFAARTLHREITAAKRVAKKGDWAAFRAWVDEYYAEAAGTTAQQIIPLATSMAQAAGCTGLQTGDLIRNYAVAVAQVMAQESMTAIKDALLVGPPDELDQTIDALLENWRWSRPDAIAEREVVRAAEMFTTKLLEAAA